MRSVRSCISIKMANMKNWKKKNHNETDVWQGVCVCVCHFTCSTESMSIRTHTGMHSRLGCNMSMLLQLVMRIQWLCGMKSACIFYNTVKRVKLSWSCHETKIFLFVFFSLPLSFPLSACFIHSFIHLFAMRNGLFGFGLFKICVIAPCALY